MTHKTAYIWGPISSFTGTLVALLLRKGWQVHVAVKSALDIFSLAPLDLQTTADMWLARAAGGYRKLHIFRERLRLLAGGESLKGTKYDAVIFAALPPNFDEARVPRAPWAARQLTAIAKRLPGCPIFILSSLWAAVQNDGVVPEELEFKRRKPGSNWERICQQYEHKLLKAISEIGLPWHLIRLPIISGSTVDGSLLNFSGLSSLIKELSASKRQLDERQGTLSFNPDATLWFLPVDTAVQFFWRIMEDELAPRICNLVSTENTLNREWMHYLACAAGFREAVAVGGDPWSLPGALRQMLKDVIQVKTRNLFEVAGRYRHTPPRLDEGYFRKLIAFGQAENWGKALIAEGSSETALAAVHPAGEPSRAMHGSAPGDD